MSVNIISLNQVVDLFQSFSERHYFLNDFGFGPTSEIGTSRQMKFPYMWVTINENGNINPQNRTAIPELPFSVLFMDKTNIQSNYLGINGDNSNNVQEVLSDMLQILQDFITEVQVDWGNYGIMFQDTVAFYPATDETQDKVNGIVGQFSFKLKHSNCILPTGDIVQTNLSPINPMTRYLTCETVTGCTTLQQYVAEQVAQGGSSIVDFDYINNNTFRIEDSNGGIFTAQMNDINVSGNITGTTYYGDGSNLTGIISTDTYVTGFTYNNNTFTISNNSGSIFNATINTMTGLTINGNLDVTTIDDVDYIDFNTSAAQTGGVGRLIWNNTDGTLDLGLKGGNVTLQVGQEQLVRVVNKTSPLIDLLEANYQVVVIAGATGQRVSVKLAKADSDINSAGTLGVVTETIQQNQEGFITTSGVVREINTTGSLQGETWNDGDVLYLSPTVYGQMTNIKPIAPQHLVVVGYVEYAHAIHGKIFVKVDNGYELDELHNVQLTGTTKGGSVLTYNQSVSVWEDTPIVWTIELINALSVDVYAPYNLSIDTVTNILNSPTITIYDDGVLYTLGNTIAIGSKITVVANSIGVTNLTLTKI